VCRKTEAALAFGKVDGRLSFRQISFCCEAGVSAAKDHAGIRLAERFLWIDKYQPKRKIDICKKVGHNRDRHRT